MARPTRVLALLATLTAAAAASVVPLATAGAAPAKTSVVTASTVFDDDTATYPADAQHCAFPVQRTFDGTLVTRTTTYADGSVLVHAWVEGLTYRLTNPANGTTLFSHLGGTEDTRFAPDGTETSDEISGNNINFTVPGGGRLTGYVGHIVETIAPDGSGQVTVQTHNMADSIFPAACAYLS